MNHLQKSVFAACIVLASNCNGATDDSPSEEAGEDDKPPPASAGCLLREVTARLPREPLTISGDLTVRKRRGIVLKNLKFQAFLDLGGIPPLAQYTIMDAFGNELERLTIVRREGSEPYLMYASGNPLVDSEAPALSAAIQETDIHWMDLTLSFLWWPGGVVVGSDETRSRPCHVVEVDNPDAGSGIRESYCAGARLWIDEKLLMLIRAELLDSDGRPIRRVWVDSFKKIDNRWIIKDMEVEAEPAVRRTKLTVREVRAGRSL